MDHGPGFYCGGWLDINSTDGKLFYQSGRIHPITGAQSRSSQFSNGTRAWMIFEQIKGFLLNKGVSHWGNSIEIRNSEFHDTKVSSMMFGSAAMVNVISTGRTPNLRLPTSWFISASGGKMGFQVKM